MSTSESLMHTHYPNIQDAYSSRDCWDSENKLITNTPNQWSESPYLGAVKLGSKFTMQSGMPMETWKQLFGTGGATVKNAPESLYDAKTHVQADRMSWSSTNDLECAFLHQELLYSGRYDLVEIWEEYLLLRYESNMTAPEATAEVLKEIIASIPNFDESKRLDLSDEKDFFEKSKKAKLSWQSAARQKKNEDNFYAEKGPRLILNTLKLLPQSTARKLVNKKTVDIMTAKKIVDNIKAADAVKDFFVPDTITMVPLTVKLLKPYL